LIFSLASSEKNIVGLVSGVPMTGGFDPQAQQPLPPWVISQQARQLFEVRALAPSFATIAPDIDLLWIVHPPALDEQTLYALDQYLLGGGRALIFVDPLAEIASATLDPTGLGGGGSSSNLETLFAAWGLEFDPTRVVMDARYALSIDTGTGLRPVRHVGLIGLERGVMSQDDLVTAGLESVNIGTAGSLSAAEGTALTLTPLLTSSTEATLGDTARFQFLADPEELLNGFVPTGQQYVIAARLGGTLNSAFPNGRPAADAESNGEPDTPAGTEESAAATSTTGSHLASTDAPNVIVVADVDVLSDRLWVQVRRSLFGQQVATAFASNGDLVTNMLGNLSGSADLIGLKSRQTFARPFDRVEALRRDADARFRETEQRLQAELAETERRLGDLQSAREDTSSLLMSPEQQAEVDRFQQEQLRIRRELREVQRELDSSIESLGVALKIVNIVAVPVALLAFGLFVLALKRRRGGS
jgi:ABC-type uncharacterized transport system involved in gliding motility auxiliary subunit